MSGRTEAASQTWNAFQRGWVKTRSTVAGCDSLRRGGLSTPVEMTGWAWLFPPRRELRATRGPVRLRCGETSPGRAGRDALDYDWRGRSMRRWRWPPAYLLRAGSRTGSDDSRGCGPRTVPRLALAVDCRPHPAQRSFDITGNRFHESRTRTLMLEHPNHFAIQLLNRSSARTLLQSHRILVIRIV